MVAKGEEVGGMDEIDEGDEEVQTTNYEINK